MSGAALYRLPPSISTQLGGEADQVIAAGRVELVPRSLLREEEASGLLRLYDVYLDHRYVGAVRKQTLSTGRVRWTFKLQGAESLLPSSRYHSRYEAVWSLLTRRLY